MLATHSSALKGARFNSLASKPLRATSRRSITVVASSKVPNADLLAVAERAADAGAAIILDAVDKPRNISYKGATDLVTDTDKASEDAILKIISEAYPDHAILGEEGGVFGNTSSGRKIYIYILLKLFLIVF
jgi:myo-inositol-1(or 4)-monophosphatase